MSSDNFVTVASEDLITENRTHCFEVQGRRLVLCRFDGTLYALDNKCTHGDSGFEKGRVRGHRLLCPLHGGIFDLRDGKVLSPPATVPLPTYPVRVVDGQVQVRLDGGG